MAAWLGVHALIIEGFRVSSLRRITDGTDVSAVIALVLDENRKLLVVKNQRGWDFPGGHVEQNETPEAALHREVLEEAYAKIRNPRLFMSASLERSMLFYVAEIAELLHFRAEHETTARTLMEPAEFLAAYDGGLPRMARYAATEARKLL